MSIRDEVKDRCSEGRLHEPGIAPGVRGVRELFVSDDVNRFLCGPWSDSAEEFRALHLVSELFWFTQGRLITIPTDSGRGGGARMSRLDPPADEVWEIRSRAPRPGIRVFGRFAVKDCFIALTWEWRRDLMDRTTVEGERLWEAVLLQCKTEWRGLFPSYNPMTGGCLHDYLSNAKVI